MQHHSHNDKPATGILANDFMISSDAIERHVAEGKRLQAEAIAAFLRNTAAFVAGAFKRAPQAAGEAGSGAMPHRA